MPKTRSKRPTTTKKTKARRVLAVRLIDERFARAWTDREEAAQPAEQPTTPPMDRSRFTNRAKNPK